MNKTKLNKKYKSYRNLYKSTIYLSVISMAIPTFLTTKHYEVFAQTQEGNNNNLVKNILTDEELNQIGISITKIPDESGHLKKIVMNYVFPESISKESINDLFDVDHYDTDHLEFIKKEYDNKLNTMRVTYNAKSDFKEGEAWIEFNYLDGENWGKYYEFDFSLDYNDPFVGARSLSITCNDYISENETSKILTVSTKKPLIEFTIDDIGPLFETDDYVTVSNKRVGRFNSKEDVLKIKEELDKSYIKGVGRKPRGLIEDNFINYFVGKYYVIIDVVGKEVGTSFIKSPIISDNGDVLTDSSISIYIKKSYKQIPVDSKNGEEIPHEGIDMPKIPGNPGETITVTPEELPEIPGYNKPNKPIQVIIPSDPNQPVEINYTKVPSVPSRPVDPESGDEIPHEGIDMPKIPGNPGETITVTPEELPEIPGYNKPNKPIQVIIPSDPNQPVEINYTKVPSVPSRPVDPESGDEIPHEGIDMPKIPGNPGETITVTPEELPEIPGYNKPNKPIQVIIPSDPNQPVEINYTKVPSVPSRPVDPESGDEIPHEGIDMPKIPGNPGETITVTPEELPEIPGYNKPNKPIQVIIPSDPNQPVEINYTKVPSVPSRPVDPESGEEIPHEGIDMPKIPGNPGETITVTPEELPEIPGYNKPIILSNKTKSLPQTGELKNSFEILGAGIIFLLSFLGIKRKFNK